MNIALISEAGGGKDFVGDYLVKKYGFTRYAFADNVKNVAETWFPDAYGNHEEKPRALLQAVGTKFREIDQDVWIRTMFEDIDARRLDSIKFGFTTESVIVTDCRMPNEYEALKKRGFTFVRVDVDNETRLQRLRDRGDAFTEEDLLHSSEQHYSTFECEYYIFNQGSRELAYAQADEVIERMINVK